jgi:hypothetical protein
MDDGKTYFVDLFLKEQNIWVEIKGYFRPDAKLKWEWFTKKFENAELWDADKLKELNIL